MSSRRLCHLSVATLGTPPSLTSMLCNRRLVHLAPRRCAGPPLLVLVLVLVLVCMCRMHPQKVELAVKKACEGKAVLNRDALKNPETIDYFAGLAGSL